jgi:hypothetical protein
MVINTRRCATAWSHFISRMLHKIVSHMTNPLKFLGLLYLWFKASYCNYIDDDISPMQLPIAAQMYATVARYRLSAKPALILSTYQCLSCPQSRPRNGVTCQCSIRVKVNTRVCLMIEFSGKRPCWIFSARTSDINVQAEGIILRAIE